MSKCKTKDQVSASNIDIKINLDAQDFKYGKYDPSESTGNILLDNSRDPDLNFYIKNIKNSLSCTCQFS